MRENWINLNTGHCVVRYSKIKSYDLADHLNTGHFRPKTGFSSLVFRPPFDNQTNSDGYCICLICRALDKEVREDFFTALFSLFNTLVFQWHSVESSL